MVFILGFFLIALGFVQPLSALVIGTFWAVFFKRKAGLGVVLIAIGGATLGLHYVVSPSHDMARYVTYMQAVSLVQSPYEFFKQMYSALPISEFGLTGRDWPLSAAILYITGKFFDYRWLSAFTVFTTLFTRIYLIVKTTEKSRFSTLQLAFLRLIFILLTIMMTTILRPASGFRWYLGSNVILWIVYFDLFKNTRLNVWKISGMIIAGLLHPSMWIYAAIRVMAWLFTSVDKTIISKIFWGIVFFVGLVTLLASSRVAPLMNQFWAYISVSDGFNVSTGTHIRFVVTFLVISILFARIKTEKFRFERTDWIFLLSNYWMLLLSVPFFLFDRLYQLAVPLMFLYYGYILAGKKRFIVYDFVVIFAMFSLYVVFYAGGVYQLLPTLDKGVFEILINPIWKF